MVRVLLSALVLYVGHVCCYYSALNQGFILWFSGFLLCTKAGAFKLQILHENSGQRAFLTIFYLFIQYNSLFLMQMKKGGKDVGECRVLFFFPTV